MDCPQIPISSMGAFNRRLYERSVKERIPLSGSIELTWRCNLRCQHCYLDPVHNLPSRKECSAAEIRRFFDQAVDEGTLFMLISGGEPLVRRDFAAIYRYARRKGLFVTLFTNGTLISERIADTLAELPPFSVEITLYGRSQATYERVTGIRGAHARCMAGIERLVERKIPFSLKTMVMSLNQHELWEMQAFADELGVNFRYDALLMPGVDTNRQPLALRLSPAETVAFDVDDPRRAESWQVFRQHYDGRRVDASRLYACEAGQVSYHIDPYGQMSMCMLARSPSYDLRQGSFRQGWREFLADVRGLPAPEGRCNTCDLLALCRQCPGWTQLENTAPRQPVEYLCQVTHLRAKATGFIGQPHASQPVKSAPESAPLF